MSLPSSVIWSLQFFCYFLKSLWQIYLRRRRTGDTYLQLSREIWGLSDPKSPMHDITHKVDIHKNLLNRCRNERMNGYIKEHVDIRILYHLRVEPWVFVFTELSHKQLFSNDSQLCVEPVLQLAREPETRNNTLPALRDLTTCLRTWNLCSWIKWKKMTND